MLQTALLVRGLGATRGSEQVLYVMRDFTVSGTMRAAALHGLTADQIRAHNSIPGLLKDDSEWTRFLTLLKLGEEPAPLAVPGLLDLLEDSTEIWDGYDDYTLVYKLADYAAIALAANQLEEAEQARLNAWLVARADGLTDDPVHAGFLFAALGDPRGMEALRDVQNQEGPPCFFLEHLLQELSQRGAGIPAWKGGG